MLIPYTASVFIYIIIFMTGTATTLLYFLRNPSPASRAIHHIKSFLLCYLFYTAMNFLYTIMAFGNNQTGIFELVLIISDFFYFAFTISWILLLSELTQHTFLKNIRFFVLITFLYALVLETMSVLSYLFPAKTDVLDPWIRFFNFLYLFLVIATGLYYFSISLFLSPGKKRRISVAASLLLILYPASELPWMSFIGLFQKTASNIIIRFDLSLLLYFFLCLGWLIQIVRRPKPASSESDASQKTDIDLSSFNLTRREEEICLLAAKGLSNSEIASDLCISENTVKHHLNNCFKKLGIKSRYELIVRISGLSGTKIDP